jgi:hypothetical protein
MFAIVTAIGLEREQAQQPILEATVRAVGAILATFGANHVTVRAQRFNQSSHREANLAGTVWNRNRNMDGVDLQILRGARENSGS